MPTVQPASDRALDHVAASASGPPLDRSLRVTLNFHPDRYQHGIPLIARLVEQGRYLSQFATGTSNGGLTAYEGGDRWRWEHRIFGGAYDRAAPDQRPVYGALNFRGRGVGAAQRFGSAHLRLTEATLERTTFCFPDSTFEPTDFGVAEHLSLIELAAAADHDQLDDYIEAQVHGGVRLDRDVEACVLDPCFRGTEIEHAARRLPCRVEWHGGFVLSVEELLRHSDYRGPEIVDLGATIAVDGRLDPVIIGAAVRSGAHDPQAIKKVWHCVARFGTRADS
ncbi:DUF3626 domain-containing protein [Microlunatus soli]|uniref:DUF3626 domain-containing protein n=1 Tax=Microlunatus soli TaxID=630515 RepID=A0A1H1ZTT4_9ACTN|nr:DUF3626 domain-containing protein [Microlunatus soli]SDT36802.1 Protein of unknown function [Microlunatus soli]